MEVTGQLHTPPVSRPGSLIPEEIASDTHWTGDGVGLRTGLDVVEKEKLWSCWISNTVRPAPSPSL